MSIIDELSDSTKTNIERHLGFKLSGKMYQAALATYNVALEEALHAVEKTMDNPWRSLSQFERAMSQNNPAIKAFVDGKITWSQMYGSKVTVTGAFYTRSHIDPSLFGQVYVFSDLKNNFTKSQSSALIFSPKFVPGKKDENE
jgi:hypothetical protein